MVENEGDGTEFPHSYAQSIQKFLHSSKATGPRRGEADINYRNHQTVARMPSPTCTFLYVTWVSNLLPLSNLTQVYLKGMSREIHQAGARTKVPMKTHTPYV